MNAKIANDEIVAKRQERTNLFYMANLGSEFMRVVSAYEKKDALLLSQSVARASGIIDKLLLNKKSDSEEKEVLILRDVLKSFSDNVDNNAFAKKSDIESYFNPFALRMLIQ
ncbi:MAG: hypothetical protein WCX27_02615 [Candidatus Paceibacterota bacterium]|jgi:hypothetical protein